MADQVVLNAQELSQYLERLALVLEGKSEALTDAFKRVGDALAVKAEEIAGEYPEKKIGVPLPLFYTRISKKTGIPFKSKFKSLKQQRYVMALIHAGKVPYKRTGFLGGSMTTTVTSSSTGVKVEVGPTVKYAQYVIGPDGVQNHYLNSLGWDHLDEQITAQSDELTHLAADVLFDEILKATKPKP